MKLQEYFLCAKKTKIMTLFNNFFSSVSVFLIRCLYILVSISKAGQKIASHPLCPNLQTCSWWLFYVQRASSSALNKAQCIQVLRQNAGSCVSSNTRMCRDTVVNAHQRLTRTRRNCWIKLFLSSLHTNYSRCFIKLRLNHWCHMGYFNDVLTTFLGLERGSSIAVYGGSESSRISSKIS